MNHLEALEKKHAELGEEIKKLKAGGGLNQRSEDYFSLGFLGSIRKDKDYLAPPDVASLSLGNYFTKREHAETKAKLNETWGAIHTGGY